ncbi:hypothetical protein BJ878DRAFT_250781 [Calycina marina]|uniref:Ferric reductase NAD binding domain-containing protein n=1 Tax=Calycina marina TaxID=1763456 RepID=A0A9P7YWR0_9HELO|nr:hypothetical protein BJ878DRAFT_250781 [Calycina marina]
MYWKCQSTQPMTVHIQSQSSAAIAHSRLHIGEMPDIWVEGPYGTPAEDLFGNEVTILIGACIGVMPWASMLKSMWYIRDPRFAKPGHRLRRVEFIWTCKDLTIFEWFQNLMTSLNDQSLALGSSDKSIRLSCHTYSKLPKTAQVVPNDQLTQGCQEQCY